MALQILIIFILPAFVIVSFSSYAIALEQQGKYNKGYILLESGIPEGLKKSYDISIPTIPIRFPNEFIPIANIDVYGTYSIDGSGEDEIWGAVIVGSISPVIKYSDDLYFIPLYDGSYERQRFFVRVEEGGRLYNEIQHHDLSLTAKYLLQDAIISPYIFGGWDLNVETTDEDWGEGLYDYNEFGSGIDLEYLLHRTQKKQITLNGGFKWYLRKYPNYKALIALATVTAPEEDEKNFNALEISAGWQCTKLQTFSLDLEYSLLMKYFTDKKVINADGILQGNKRKEYRNTLRIEMLYIPRPESNLQYSYSSELTYNVSNQNFYDSRGTTTLNDDVFTSNYFDYISFDLHPKFSYMVRSGDRILAIIGVGYYLLVRNYSDRKAQAVNGTYTSDNERDYQHIFETTFEIPFDEHLSWVLSYDYTINKSNMDFEQYYEYNYSIHRILTGISLSY
jgi:hypothetical protein